MCYIKHFLEAQENDISIAISELRSGRKKGCWMWYIFPQISLLGQSRMAKYYGINKIDKAVSFITNPVLRANYLACLEALLGHKGKLITKILGEIDSLKLKSSLTLFKVTCEDEEVFEKICKVLECFFDGEECKKTLMFLSDN